MTSDKDILFITPTVWTRWLGHSKRIIAEAFPESEHVVVDGTKRWPYDWFDWIGLIKGKPQRWVVHIDEDCFLRGREELLRLIETMEEEGTTLAAVSDGYNHYRGANAVAVNSFFMVVRTDHVNELDIRLSDLRIGYSDKGWTNHLGLRYDPARHGSDFVYPHEIMVNGSNTAIEQEPYYMLLWMLKDRGRKFRYLYPRFDGHLKSTNPRIDEGSPDIAVHMWYARQCDQAMPVHGVPNSERYRRLSEILEGHRAW
jgi:hypothetical protein